MGRMWCFDKCPNLHCSLKSHHFVACCRVSNFFEQKLQSIFGLPEGMEATKRRNAKNRCLHRNHDFGSVDFSVIGVQLCSNITAMFLPRRRFFLIRLNGLRFGSDLYLCFTFCNTTIFRFWIFWGRGFIIFDERNLFLSQRYKIGTYGNRISTRVWFAFIPSSPLSIGSRLNVVF